MLARLLELHVAVIGNDDPKFLLHQIVLKRYQLDFEISPRHESFCYFHGMMIDEIESNIWNVLNKYYSRRFPQNSIGILCWCAVGFPLFDNTFYCVNIELWAWRGKKDVACIESLYTRSKYCNRQNWPSSIVYFEKQMNRMGSFTFVTFLLMQRNKLEVLGLKMCK